MPMFRGNALHPPAIVLGLLSALFVSFNPGDAAAQEVSTEFVGGAVPSGSVQHSRDGAKHVLTLSEDFSIHEEPPDPHWRVIDSSGNVFLLDKLKIQDDRINTSIVLPPYIADVAKVQMWCAFAEVVLGEATFRELVSLR